MIALKLYEKFPAYVVLSWWMLSIACQIQYAELLTWSVDLDIRAAIEARAVEKDPLVQCSSLGDTVLCRPFITVIVIGMRSWSC